MCGIACVGCVLLEIKLHKQKVIQFNFVNFKYTMYNQNQLKTYIPRTTPSQVKMKKDEVFQKVGFLLQFG